MRQPKRATEEIPQARFKGARWVVAMCDKDWAKFCTIPMTANARLVALLEYFCEHGEDNLPGKALRWMSREGGQPNSGNFGAFEARGVVLHGRQAPNESGRTFFVTQIIVDLPPADSPSRTRRNISDRQGFLPFGPKK